MNLFEHSSAEQIRQQAPLADRMRPRILEEFVGQNHILAPGRLLRRAIQADQLSSIIFYGPPGTGKTTLARIIANTTKAEFLSINAVLSGIADIRKCVETARNMREQFQKKSLLFVDEVHRFNKAQQDALLPHVENGTVILIGATTENPYFEVNKALVSRSRIFQLKSLESTDIENIIDQAIADKERGFGKKNIDLEKGACEHLAHIAAGDARAALNALELAVLSSEVTSDDSIYISLEVAEESIQQRAVLYDKDGDAHFDTISAFIKSMRGSDPDAALFWMAKMIVAGEDPRFIFRRMIIFAGEDVGLADPHALSVVTSAAQAYDYVGMPEGRYHLAQACLYLSTAPKSNSAFAFFDAISVVEKELADEVPDPLKDASRDGKAFGHGQGYLYPHAYRDHWVAQQYLPDVLQGRLFYQPSDQGYEANIKVKVAQNREAQLAAFFTNTEETHNQEQDYWETRTMGNAGLRLSEIRNQIMQWANLQRNSLSLVLNADDGLILGETLRKITEETVYGLVGTAQHKEILSGLYENKTTFLKPEIAVQTGTLSETFEIPGIQFEHILGRNVLQNYPHKIKYIDSFCPFLIETGELILAESVPSMGQKLSDLIPIDVFKNELSKKIKNAEKEIYRNSENSRSNWSPASLKQELSMTQWKIIKWKVQEYDTPTYIASKQIQEWFDSSMNNSYSNQLSKFMDSEEIKMIKSVFQKYVAGKTLAWRSVSVFMKLSKDHH